MLSRRGCCTRSVASSAATKQATHSTTALRKIAFWHRQAPPYTCLLQLHAKRRERLLAARSAQPAQGVTTSCLAEKLQALGASSLLVLEHPELRDADPELLDSGLQSLSDWVPRRSLGPLLERHPPLLTAPVGAWGDFLASFGFQRLAIQELFLNSPDVITSSSVFRAGQVFLFLRQLGLSNQQIVGPIFRWRALLAEGVDYQAAASFLVSEGGLHPDLLPRLATTYPTLLAAPVEGEGGMRPRLAFLQGLGPGAAGVLRGVLWEEWCGWLHGLANWSTAVAPKLTALEAVVGSGGAAEALLRLVPEALRYPPESRLAPNLRLLMGSVGLQGEPLSSLLLGASSLLSLSPDQLESRWTFLLEAANGDQADLLAHPPYLLAPLDKVTGPRLFYTALRGLTTRLTQPQHQAETAAGGAGGGTGGGAGGGGGGGHNLDLKWLVEGSDEEWLRRVAAEQRRRGAAGGLGGGGGGEEEQEEEEVMLLLRGDYEEVVSEWDSLLGWCCDRAFTAAGRKRFEEQLSLFYLLVQG
ncbi:hypothetical protein PLESTB_001358000 [Pleodorina starrii]|uniref:Uncharacterized protein n=1 Tax=Pleodorina starrii TaxID=330485 RepID=A0A9W6BVT1_9CHLO|nr:hypothetical protein PLESTM_001917800 [Pleodorina starrii]GLC58431.1 hypothetical protein PLESTB_001358000 [Pleodorina starrii]GLC76486.1 hypothetical protein PLESTF_001786400 [Pleodorina starrii]